MEIPKSIAVIGEGETEWFYFDSLRLSCRYPFKIAPAMPQHSDIPHMVKMAEQFVAREYDVVICLVDMDRLLANPTEMNSYKRIKSESDKRILWIETNPCTEFWFLLHFLPELAIKHYETCDEVMIDLRKYMPGYEKTTRYLKKIKLYEYLRQHGNLNRAIQYSERLSKLSEESQEDRIAYSQMGFVLNLLAEYSRDLATDVNPNLISVATLGEIEMKILDFLTSTPDSDIKSISIAIGLKQSRTSDYLKRLMDLNHIECMEGWKKTYRIKEV